MAVWFSGPFEGSVHQVILGAVSEDGGETWGQSRVINDAPRVSDFDPGFINAGDRTLLFFSNGRWTDLPSPGPQKQGRPQVGVDSFHMLLMTSDDQGKTWRRTARNWCWPWMELPVERHQTKKRHTVDSHPPPKVPAHLQCAVVDR